MQTTLLRSLTAMRMKEKGVTIKRMRTREDIILDEDGLGDGMLWQREKKIGRRQNC